MKLTKQHLSLLSKTASGVFDFNLINRKEVDAIDGVIVVFTLPLSFRSDEYDSYFTVYCQVPASYTMRATRYVLTIG